MAQDAFQPVSIDVHSSSPSSRLNLTTKLRSTQAGLQPAVGQRAVGRGGVAPPLRRRVPGQRLRAAAGGPPHRPHDAAPAPGRLAGVPRGLQDGLVAAMGAPLQGFVFRASRWSRFVPQGLPARGCPGHDVCAVAGFRALTLSPDWRDMHIEVVAMGALLPASRLRSLGSDLRLGPKQDCC